MHLTQALRRAAQLQPGACASLCGDRSRTFGELETRVARLAGALRQLGVRDGNSVAIAGRNSDRYLECLLATPWAGAAITPFDHGSRLPHLIKALNQAETVAIFIDQGLAGQVDALLDGCPFLRYLIFYGDDTRPADTQDYEALIAGAEPIAASEQADDELFGIFQIADPAGPRAVMLSQRNIDSAATALLVEGAASGASIGLHAGPLSAVTAPVLTAVLLMRGAAQTMVAEDAAETADAIRRHGVTDLLASSATLQSLLETTDAAPFESVRCLLSPLSTASGSLPEAASKRLPNARLLRFYGRAEHSAVATVEHGSPMPSASPPDGMLCAIGRAAHQLSVRVIDADGREVERGEVGSFAVRGPTAMLGYLHAPEATAAGLKGGWLRTGELATMDRHGTVRLVVEKAEARGRDEEPAVDGPAPAAPSAGSGFVRQEDF